MFLLRSVLGLWCTSEQEHANQSKDFREETPVTHCSTTGMPRKRFYRARAHSNPLNDCQFPVYALLVQIMLCLCFGHRKTFNHLLGKHVEGWSVQNSPSSAKDVDWHTYFPAYFPDESKPEVEFMSKDPSVTKVTIADVGCGFGGLTVRPATPEVPVSEYVKERIEALRKTEPGQVS
eukprot:1192208-Prorocentrum_minimum.AAC.13